MAVAVLAYGSLALVSLRNDTRSLVTQYNNLELQVARLRADNKQTQDAITAQNAQSDTLSAQAVDVQQQITLVQDNEAFFNNTLDNLKLGLDNSDKDVREIVNDAPSGLSITDIEYSVEGITVKGVASSQSLILTYARSLRSGGRFASVTVSSIETTPDGLFAFTFILR